MKSMKHGVYYVDKYIYIYIYIFTDLSAQQWRDRVHLQYGWDLQGLPEKCDGCGKRFSLIMLSCA